MTDEDLMFAYQSGDSNAFNTLYDRYSGKVYGYLKLRLKKSNDIDDVFQKVFLKFHQSKNQYRPQFPVLQWLFVISRSVLLDHIKRKAIPTELLSDQIAAPLPDEPGEGFDLGLLSQLSGDHRKIVELRIFDEKAFEEIARIVGYSTVNVRQIFSRALKKLRLAGGTHGF